METQNTKSTQENIEMMGRNLIYKSNNAEPKSDKKPLKKKLGIKSKERITQKYNSMCKSPQIAHQSQDQITQNFYNQNILIMNP